MKAILEKDFRKAKQLAVNYSFTPYSTQSRQYTPIQAMHVFYRDGFIDRYSGDKLINPGILRLLSLLLPEDFPFHPNWKMSESHSMYWELYPTVDHVIPIAAGGNDNEENWVTTSMLRNSAKSNWRLEDLGWSLCPPGGIHEWDGLSKVFINYISENTHFLDNSYLKIWYRATIPLFK